MSFPASSQIEARNRRGAVRERRCVASDEVLPETQLIRFALGPGGVLAPDVAAKLPGRGAWVRADRASIERAVRKDGFSRTLKRSARAPAGLADLTERLLAKRCLDLIGMARRAGGIAVGATQVEQAIRAAPALLLIEASDGAHEGREKLMGLHIGLWGRPPATLGCFSAADLGVALGRERVIHACLLQERLAAALAADIGRLAGFRTIVPDSWPDSWRLVGWGLGGAVAAEDAARRGEET
ncbi:MAG: RNA-binding protein [Proteobacteria bacterium]|nr:RNA-binding protein [Pseudomonadota bacterium]